MFKSLNYGKLPQRATRHSCGFDVCANEDILIGAGENAMIGLGIAIDENSSLYQELKSSNLLNSYFFELHPRSSMFNKGLIFHIGIIDIDYFQEIKMLVNNPLRIDFDFDYAHRHFKINKGDKIGQLIFKRHEGDLLPAEYTLNVERTGGVGSTGGYNDVAK